MKQYFSLWFVVIVCCWKCTRISARSTTICTSQPCLNSAKLLKEAINETARPCDNFYQYACGNWMKNHPTLTKYASTSSLGNRKLQNHNEIREFLNRSNNDTEPKALHKARKLFNLCLDTDKLNRKGLQPLKDLMHQIGISIIPNEKFDLVEKSVKLARITGLDFLYSVSVSDNPYNRTENKLSISEPLMYEMARLPTFTSVKRSEETTNNGMSDDWYNSKLLKLLCELLENETNCYNSSNFDLFRSHNHSTIVKQVTEYANSRSETISKVYPADMDSMVPRSYTLRYLQNLTDYLAIHYSKPSLNWTRNIALMFSGIDNVTIDLSEPEKVEIMFEEPFVKDILHFIYSHDDSEHEMGMVRYLTDTLAQYLSHELHLLKWNHTSDLVDAGKNRADWCTTAVSHLMGMAVSYYYATTEDYKSVKKNVTDMTMDIQEVFQDVINSSSWIDQKTRKAALKKLQSMRKFIGYPSFLLNGSTLDNLYSHFEITDDFLESVLGKATKEAVNELRLLNQTNDVNSYPVTLAPVIVNAFYMHTYNIMIIPAAILGNPVYGHGLQCLNYGSIGSLIGHEMNHGFDSKGRRFNYEGNLEDWWEPATLIKFNEKSDCFKTAYKKYSETLNAVNVTTDSSNTLGENIADNGGFKQALQAYRNYVSRNGEESLLGEYENFNGEQLFTLSFGNLWCENPTAYSVQTGSKDHSPNALRLNGVLRNSVDFAKIWNCPKGSNMNPDTEKCNLW